MRRFGAPILVLAAGIVLAAVVPASAQDGDANAELERELEELREEQRSMRARMASLVANLEELQSRLEAERQTREQLLDQQRGLERQVQGLERQLEALARQTFTRKLQEVFQGLSRGFEEGAEELGRAVGDPEETLEDLEDAAEDLMEMAGRLRPGARPRPGRPGSPGDSGMPEEIRRELEEQMERLGEQQAGGDGAEAVPVPGTGGTARSAEGRENASRVDLSSGGQAAMSGQVSRGNAGWYRVAAEPGADVRVVVEFEHDDGDVDVEAQAEGGNALGSSMGMSDREELDITVPSDGHFYVRVYGFGGAENDYDVTFEAR